MRILFFCLLLLACTPQTIYQEVRPSQELIPRPEWQEYTLYGSFKGVGSLDTIQVYVHQPNDSIKQYSFVRNYHLRLPVADYYHVYFVNITGRTKRITIDNCGTFPFSLYTDVDFSFNESLLVSLIDVYDSPRLIMQRAKRPLRYRDVIK